MAIQAFQLSANNTDNDPDLYIFQDVHRATVPWVEPNGIGLMAHYGYTDYKGPYIINRVESQVNVVLNEPTSGWPLLYNSDA